MTVSVLFQRWENYNSNVKIGAEIAFKIYCCKDETFGDKGRQLQGVSAANIGSFLLGEIFFFLSSVLLKGWNTDTADNNLPQNH